MKFYYIKGETLDDVEEMDSWRDSQLPSRKWVRREFDDYPTHKHRSYAMIQVMEVIPEKKYENTKYLNKGKFYSNDFHSFNTIELDSSEVFKYNGHYYIIEFEKRLNTTIWKLYTHQIDY